MECAAEMVSWVFGTHVSLPTFLELQWLGMSKVPGKICTIKLHFSLASCKYTSPDVLNTFRPSFLSALCKCCHQKRRGGYSESGSWSLCVNIVSTNSSSFSFCGRPCLHCTDLQFSFHRCIEETSTIFVSFWNDIVCWSGGLWYISAFWLQLINLHIYRCVCTSACVRVCVFVHVCIESSAAPGKGMPARWQMVGIKLAKSSSPLHEHTAHMAANSPTCLLSSQDSFCTLFAERNFSPHLQNLLWVRFTSGSTGPSDSSAPMYSSLCNATLPLCPRRLIMCETALLRGNTTVWKQTSSKNKTVCCLWR